MLQNGWGKKAKAITITLILLSLQVSVCLSVYLCVCEFGACFSTKYGEFFLLTMEMTALAVSSTYLMKAVQGNNNLSYVDPNFTFSKVLPLV